MQVCCNAQSSTLVNCYIHIIIIVMIIIINFHLNFLYLVFPVSNFSNWQFKLLCFFKALGGNCSQDGIYIWVSGNCRYKK